MTDQQPPPPIEPRSGQGVAGPDAEVPATSAGGDPAVLGTGKAKHLARQVGRKRHHPLPWIVIVLVAAFIAVIVRIFFVQTFYVPSASMVPTLQPHDRMFVLKTGYTIERGAILVFRHPPGDTGCGGGNDDLVKRVVGLPGETIWSVGNTVYIDGKPLAQPWLPKNDPLGRPITRQRIPKNEYFMMGDNRAESCDSRYWGVLPRSLVVGRVFLVIWRNGHPVFDVI